MSNISKYIIMCGGVYNRTCDVDNKRDVVKFNNEVFGMQ